VRCVVAGRGRTTDRLVGEIPMPALPSGMYTSGLSPYALEELGFRADSVVCATLEAPSSSQVSAAFETTSALREARERANDALDSAGPCVCQSLARTGDRGLVPHCGGVTTRKRCEDSPEARAEARTEAEALVAPVRSALAAVELPRLHWRMAGTSDWPRRFVARKSEIIVRHPGPSEVFRRGAAPPTGGNVELVKALLGRDDVFAVVRQDQGKALLVVREHGRSGLVIDYFAFPQGMGTGLQPLQAALDDASIAWFMAALDPPKPARALVYDPREGTVLELDHAGLERVDEGLVAITHVLSGHYDSGRELKRAPALLFDRVAMQVPLDGRSERMKARLMLTAEGEAWCTKAAEDSVVVGLDTLAGEDSASIFAPGGRDPGFVLRGQPLSSSIFSGLNSLPALFQALEQGASGSVQGRMAHWSVSLPSGPMPGEFDTKPGLKGLRERLSMRSHQLSGELKGPVLYLEMKPE